MDDPRTSTRTWWPWAAKRALAVAVGILVAAAATVVAPSPATAASVWGFGGGVIINVQTGEKNFSNRTQWVSSIYIEVGTAANQAYGCGKFEAWTQGFYAQAERCQTVYWTINRWVATGNNVCGAFDDFDGWPRRIACISIRV